MKHLHQDHKEKPYDIRQRLLLFACNVVAIGQKLQHRDRLASRLSEQLVTAAVSAAANLEEADDGSSRRDFRAKLRIALRETKEARVRLRILVTTGYLPTTAEPLISESSELVKILATIIRNSERGGVDK